VNIILLMAVIALLVLAGLGWAGRRARGRRNGLVTADPGGAGWMSIVGGADGTDGGGCSDGGGGGADGGCGGGGSE
jgi:hypothetical protein